jgi:hypothetical protein
MHHCVHYSNFYCQEVYRILALSQTDYVTVLSNHSAYITLIWCVWQSRYYIFMHTN